MMPFGMTAARRAAVLGIAWSLSLAAAADATRRLDDCEDASSWRVIASDGVLARLSTDTGLAGDAIRLDYDFTAGSGFCVLRRELRLPLDENYRFSFDLRGEGRENNLEFKLIDESGDSVWWVNQRDYRLPAEWTRESHRRRHFQFAWGPSGGAPLKAVSAIEIAVAASAGGKGYLLIDSLCYEPLAAPNPSPQPAILEVHASDSATPRRVELLQQPIVDCLLKADAAPAATLDLRQMREFGGLILDWDRQAYPVDYDLTASVDGESFEPLATVRGAAGGRNYIPVRDGEARALALVLRKLHRPGEARLMRVEIAPVEFAQSGNSMFARIAGDSPRGQFPRAFLGEQTYWTVVGVPSDENEALLSTDGVVEVAKRGFSIEPFLEHDGRLHSWADDRTTQRLEQGDLPVPSVLRKHEHAELEVTAFADGAPGTSLGYVRYRLRNTGDAAGVVKLLLAVRPFQVLPPWQALNLTGGTSRIESIQFLGADVIVNEAQRVRFLSECNGFEASTFDAGDALVARAAGVNNTNSAARDPRGFASGLAVFERQLPAGGEAQIWIAFPFHDAAVLPEVAEGAAHQAAARLTAVCDQWRKALSRTELTLPRAHSWLAETYRTTQAYILINRDGPAIQPGSRTYERSWIRDGASSGVALLDCGHVAEVRQFLDWYAEHQYPDGKVPCVVDLRGPDPVAEHDSHGEYIHAVARYVRRTGDTAFLDRHLPHVTAAVNYIESLCALRRTEEYREGPPEKRAMYGLVPESISHEGYSAKPMHSYWDDFYVARGLKDAVELAERAGRHELAERFAALRDAFRAALAESVRRAIELKGIDFIPGCVELGDFDATSTAIAVYPCEETDSLPPPALQRTLDRYMEFFRARRDGAREWRDYTPYELRIVATLLRLGRTDDAHELLEFFARDRRPHAWNHWAEVVWRDPAFPGFIGDMPHTWVSSEFLHAVRSLFVYESGQTLVLAQGVRAEWLAGGEPVAIQRFPTDFGTVTYSLRRAGDALEFELDAQAVPPEGFLLHVPAASPTVEWTLDGVRQPQAEHSQIRLHAARARVRISL